MSTLGNILWFIFAGVWLAIGHVATALGLFLTIICCRQPKTDHLNA